MRVILVGRTGLDAALRLDETIELIRVRTALEALGELAAPIEGHRAGVTTVVLGPDIVQRLRETAPAGLDEVAALEEFVIGLRHVDPDARVIAAKSGGGADLPPAVDGVIDPVGTAEQVRQRLRELSGLMRPGIPGEEMGTVEAGGSGDAGGAEIVVPGGPGGAPGDLALVTLMLRGREVAEACLAIIRERTGDASVMYHATEPKGGAEIRWDSATLGWLTAEKVPHKKLEQHARWMAGWLWLRDQQTQLRSAAFTDPLTGAWNRRYFDRFLGSAIEQARNTRRSFTLMVFDIDDFKQYNDKFGHEAGDEILTETVRLLRSCIRPTDRVCRIGGDEFAVIFHDPEGPRQEGSKPPESVAEIAQRFQKQIGEHTFPKLAGTPSTLTISGGLATFPWDGSTPEELLARADQLALRSKRQGKNVLTFGPGSQRAER